MLMMIECFKCFRVLANTSVSLDSILSHVEALNTLVLCLDFPATMKAVHRILLLNLLTVICGCRKDGHRFNNKKNRNSVYFHCKKKRKIMEALKNFRLKKQETNMFDTLLRHFQESQSMELKVAYLSFINALINSPSDTSLRVAIRQSFIDRGLQKILEVN